MTEDQRYEIAVLAEDAHQKRERFQWLGMMNTPPAGTPEAAQSRVEYEIARAEMLEAEAKLNRAMRAIAGG